MDGGNAWMLQLAGDPRLTEEALGGRRVGRVAIGQQLDGHIAIESGIAGAVDDAHAAAADLVAQLVARRTGARSARLDDGDPARSRGLCQVFGHGVAFPSISIGGRSSSYRRRGRRRTGPRPARPDLRKKDGCRSFVRASALMVESTYPYTAAQAEHSPPWRGF